MDHRATYHTFLRNAGWRCWLKLLSEKTSELCSQNAHRQLSLLPRFFIQIQKKPFSESETFKKLKIKTVSPMWREMFCPIWNILRSFSSYFFFFFGKRFQNQPPLQVNRLCKWPESNTAFSLAPSKKVHTKPPAYMPLFAYHTNALASGVGSEDQNIFLNVISVEIFCTFLLSHLYSFTWWREVPAEPAVLLGNPCPDWI